MAVTKYLLTQYNLKADLKHFGEKGIAVTKGELTQLHVMDTWVPEDPTMLSRSEKVKDLSSLMFLKEKRNGKAKGRACVNGEPKRAYISKEYASSTTVANESVFITSVMAANKIVLYSATMYQERFYTQNLMKMYYWYSGENWQI